MYFYELKLIKNFNKSRQWDYFVKHRYEALQLFLTVLTWSQSEMQKEHNLPTIPATVGLAPRDFT